MLLCMKIEESWTRIRLGAFSEREYFVCLKTRLSSTIVELHLFVVLGLDDISTHHLGDLLHPVVQRSGVAGLVKLFSLGLNH